MNIRLSDHFTFGKLLRFSLPSIGMMLFTSVYWIIDGFFISNCVGKTAFAAVNLIMPVLIVTGSLGYMIGTGGCALVARILGTGDRGKANRTFSQLIEYCVVLGVLSTVAVIAFLEPLARMLGATEDMMADVLTYGRIMLVFGTAFILQYAFQNFFVSAEKPQLGFLFTVAAGLTNAVLDWLLVGVLKLGTAGAAFASCTGQCVGGLLPIVYFARPNTSLLRFRLTPLELRPLLSACYNGLSELMSNISGSVVGILFNFQLLHYAGENGVAAFGVVMYSQMIFFSLFIGYAIGTSPVVSYHFGAEHPRELRNLLQKSFVIMLLSGGAMTAMGIGLAGPMARIFVGYDRELLAMTTQGFQIFAWSFLLAGLNIYASAFFTALNNGTISGLLSFLRTFVFQSAMVLLLPGLLGMEGIWWATAAAELLALGVSASLIAAHRKKYQY